jgi:iron complex outermembrane receptor protein
MKKKACRLSVVAPLLLSVAVPTAAQENTLMLEEVIVTAQKREESLQDAPISIAAFSQEALTQEGIGAIDDLQGKVPSLNLTPFPTQNTSLRIFIRGVGAGDIQVTQDPAVGVYIDQVYIGRSTGLAMELADLAQIEVLRGAQGTLFGRNSIGGAINMTTIKPHSEGLEFKQEFGAGNRNLFRSKTSANIPITDDLALRAVYMYREKDGYVDNDGPGEDFLDSEDKGGKLDFLWQPNDKWSVRYAYDFSESEFVSPTFQAIEEGALSEQYEIPVDSGLLTTLSTKDEMRTAPTDIEGHALTIARDWDSYTFKSITAYRDFEYQEFTNLESGSASESLYLNSNAGLAVLGHLPTLKQDQLSQEFQLLANPSESFDYVVGFYYFDENATKKGGSGSKVFVQQPSEANNFDIKNEAWAVYGQSNWTPDILDSRLTITTGIRYTEDERYAAREYMLFEGNPSDSPDWEPIQIDGYETKPESDYENVSYTAVANFAITDDINTYVKLATGYKSGGYNIRASTEEGYATGFDEEEITTWELGLKSELLDRRVRLNAAAYFSLWEDIQLNLSDASTPSDVRDTNVINAGEGEMSGVEFDLMAMLTEGLTLVVAYAYQDAKFTEVEDPSDDTLNEDDFVFTNSPRHQYTVNLNYTRPLSFGMLSTNLNYNWVDDRLDSQKAWEAENGRAVIESYGLLGAYLGISEIGLGQSGELTVALWGRNLLDEEYFTTSPTVLNDAPFPGAGLYDKIVIFGEPESYGVDLVYHFSK